MCTEQAVRWIYLKFGMAHATKAFEHIRKQWHIATQVQIMIVTK